MKQSLRLSSVLLLVLVLSLILSACDDISLEEIWNSNANISTEFETADRPEQSVPEDTDSTPEETEQADTGDVSGNNAELTQPLEQPYDPEKEVDYLIHALKTYIIYMKYQFLMVGNTYETKFDMAVESNCVLYVELDPETYYFVCAYSDSGHEHEFVDQCCLDGYTWVKFDSEEQITETYNDKDFVVCFQINKTLSCIEILSKDDQERDMEHYQLYWPEFADGVNTAKPLTISSKYLYFYSYDFASEYHLFHDPRVIYHSVDCHYHKPVVLSLTDVDGEDYVKVFLSTQHPDGSTSDSSNVQEYFGKYYDDAMRAMITGKYHETEENGTIHNYGLLGMNEIAEIIKSNMEKAQ